MVAAFFHSENRMGVGMCLMGDDECFILAKAHWRDTKLPVKEGDAYALLMAIQWVKELGLKNVIFEFDCKAVADNIDAAAPHMNEFGSIITHCKELIVSVQSSRVQFAYRAMNVQAHKLARCSIYYPRNFIFHCFPDCNSVSTKLSMI